VKLYLKYIISLVFSSLWVFVSFYFSYPWILEISNYIGFVLAFIVVFGVSLLPGMALSFVGISLFIDKRPIHKLEKTNFPPISILIAAYNEEKTIYSTLQSIYSQKYSGDFEIVIVNDGSKDKTSELVKLFKTLNGYENILLIDNKENSGKSKVLNIGLGYCNNELIVGVDADCVLHKSALEEIVKTMIGSDENYAAVAGAILCKNHSKSFISKLQYWDYFLGISSIKRVQSMYQGTMVAQGAFSIYKKSILEEIGGWPNKVGEDIVLTWSILNKDYKIGHSENAICFTNVPETYKGFYNQRKRWSRGLIEAFFSHPNLLFKKRKSTFFIWYNLFFPLIDFIYLFVFIPGVILALFFKFYLLAGFITLLQIPLAIIYNTITFLIQKQSMKSSKLNFPLGMMFYSLIYILIYQLVMIPATLDGYLSEFLNKKKTW